MSFVLLIHRPASHEEIPLRISITVGTKTFFPPADTGNCRVRFRRSYVGLLQDLCGNTLDTRSIDTILNDLDAAGFKDVILITDSG